MLTRLLKLIFKLPLPILHGVGIVLGWVMYLSDKRFSRRIRKNLLAANIARSAKQHAKLARQTGLEIGKGLVESLAIWLSPQTRIVKWVKGCTGWEHVEAAFSAKKGIIFLTPHLGCYEITAQYVGALHPLTILFKPPRTKWLLPTMIQGRAQGKITLAETNMSGVRSLMKTLRSGGAIGILPDQVPSLGEGEWAEFFGHPAYTMSLASKLANTTGATVILTFGERLSFGRGFHLHFELLGSDSSPQAINHGIERLVEAYPTQYLWSYQRYKTPNAGKTTKPAETNLASHVQDSVKDGI